VVGAGAFGGWTALHLVRAGADVTLLDAWGPANPRASSGDDTRVIRHVYDTRVMVDLVVRSLEQWRENGARWGVELLRESGVLWMVGGDDGYERAAVGHLREAGVAFEALEAREIAKRHGWLNVEGIRWGIHEPRAGFLRARRACECVRDAVVREGGAYREAAVLPPRIGAGRISSAMLEGGGEVTADSFVFACGPWLGRLFPELLGPRVLPTRQEVFYFAVPPGGPPVAGGAVPVWGDHGEHFWYGIPEAEGPRFKIANDTWGPPFDPTLGDRTPSAAGEAAARRHMEFRFPGMRGAALQSGRVCQYETTPDNRYILDRHPAADNVWIAGGGSGHGFKNGPAVGETMAACVLGRRAPEPFFGLGRLA
jgi:sarcosine oxidase